MTNFFKPGNKVLIRTVTTYQVGRVKEQGEDHIVLEDSSWVVDTGDFAEALSSGKLERVESVPGDHYVSLGAIVDAFPWPHTLPRS